jgi:hypothetical protein
MKKVRNDLTVLERQLNELYETHGIEIPPKAFPYIRNAMKSFAVNAIQEYKRNRKRQMVRTLRYLPKAFRIAYQEFFIQWLRKIFLNKSIKTGKIKAYNENYKQYIVRATEYTYKIFSTLEFKHNKRVRILKKDLTVKDVERKAARVIYPKIK